MKGDGGVPNFDGTLFRFPLRTTKQANNGKIVDRPYRRKDMIDLLRQFIKNAGNLLLFSQNVEKITIQHIPADSSDLRAVDVYTIQRESQIGCDDMRPLQKVSNMHDNHDDELKTTYEFMIRARTTSHATQVLGLNEDELSCSWFVSWASGMNESKKKAVLLSRKGVVALGGVALPKHFLLTESGDSALLNVQSVPEGFYRVSHVFCFLPLPIEVSLPVHINGCFFVDKSRRSLALRETDTLGANDEVVWNDVLLRDAVCLSYLELLEKLPIGYSNLEDKGNGFTTLWPKFNEKELMSLVKGFYNGVAESTHSLFEKHGTKYKLKDCVFLHHDLIYHTQLGDVASECFDTFFQMQGKVTMRIPEAIYEQFKLADVENNVQEISCNRFFIDVFLPNITDSFWDNKTEQRNSMLLFGLRCAEENSSEASDLRKVIQNTACIPSRPRGRLVKPCELVEDMVNSPIADMFCDEDERFIQTSSDGRFQDHDILKILRNMGMMSGAIPDELILERAKSLELMQERTQQLKRTKALTTYLMTLGEDHLNALATDLSNISWIPVLLQKPDDFPFQWFSRDTGFCRPGEAYGSHFRLLCGSVAHIHETYVEKLLDKIYHEKRPTTSLVLEQFKLVVQSVQDYENSSDAQRVIETIYDFLNSRLDELKTFDLQATLQNTPLIWTGSSDYRF